jgi:hypothetical protein
LTIEFHHGIFRRMSHGEIIDRLGGHNEVATFLCCRPNRVIKWKIRGIPPSLFALIVRLAEQKGLSLTEAELIATSPAKRLAARDLTHAMEMAHSVDPSCPPPAASQRSSQEAA